MSFRGAPGDVKSFGTEVVAGKKSAMLCRSMGIGNGFRLASGTCWSPDFGLAGKGNCDEGLRGFIKVAVELAHFFSLYFRTMNCLTRLGSSCVGSGNSAGVHLANHLWRATKLPCCNKYFISSSEKLDDTTDLTCSPNSLRSSPQRTHTNVPNVGHANEGFFSGQSMHFLLACSCKRLHSVLRLSS